MHPGGRGNDESKGLPEEKHVVFHPEGKKRGQSGKNFILLL